MRVVAGLARQDNLVFMARRSFSKHHGGLWEFPGGKVEAGESDQEALKREFLEEFQIDVDVGLVFTQVQLDLELVVINIHLNQNPMILTSHSEFGWFLPEEVVKIHYCPADELVIQELLK